MKRIWKPVVLAAFTTVFSILPAQAATEKREFPEFCSMYALRFADLSEEYDLGFYYLPGFTAPIESNGKIHFGLQDLGVVVDSTTFDMEEISLTFTDQNEDDRKRSERLACLISMVSALEYSYLEDVFAGNLGSYGLAEKPNERAGEIVKNEIMPAYTGMDTDTLVRSNNTLFPLYKGNYEYYVRHISYKDTWWIDIVAKPYDD